MLFEGKHLYIFFQKCVFLIAVARHSARDEGRFHLRIEGDGRSAAR